MFVGHGLLAFAVVALAARTAGETREAALGLGGVAFFFGVAPDVDILYGPVGVVGATSVFDAAEKFWAAGNQFHRAMTHSLVFVFGGTVLAGGSVAGVKGRLVGATTALSLVATAVLYGGVVDGAIAAAFCAVLVTVAVIGSKKGVTGWKRVAAAALVALFFHPFGDFLTGTPPELFFPFGATEAGRVSVFADPTLALFAPLLLELATAWAALGVYYSVSDAELPRVRPESVTASGFAPVLHLTVTPPTLAESYQFVFPLVGVGVVATLLSHKLGRGGVDSLFDGLSVVTVSAVAYLAVYAV